MTAQPLDTLITLAREARDNTGQLLAGERRDQQQLATQMDLLNRYRDEYCQRLQQTMGEGIDLATLRDYQQFLCSLDAAIDNARNTMEEQRCRIAKRQQQWQQEQLRLSSYDTLAARRDAMRLREEQRREQRTTDEFTTNAFARKRLGLAAQEVGSAEPT
ncbi:MAG: flagellar export protein FliJ [Porticoccaceae bacterium]